MKYCKWHACSQRGRGRGRASEWVLPGPAPQVPTGQATPPGGRAGGQVGGRGGFPRPSQNCFPSPAAQEAQDRGTDRRDSHLGSPRHCPDRKHASWQEYCGLPTQEAHGAADLGSQRGEEGAGPAQASPNRVRDTAPPAEDRGHVTWEDGNPAPTGGKRVKGGIGARVPRCSPLRGREGCGLQGQQGGLLGPPGLD